MAFTIFYSWQSDKHNKVNRNFIEDALRKAIKKVGEDITVQESLRDKEIKIDKDTKGIPGTPPIADIIFDKISSCGIFVPDLTFVGKTDKGRPLPNPNVLIEYGWALREVSHSRIIAVMNTAFGEPTWETLPFNMRHLRYPLTYHLKEDALSDECSKVRAELIDKLTSAIELIIKKNLIGETVSKPEPFPETPYTTNPSTFLEPGKAFAIDEGSGEPIFLPNVERIFLRIIPTTLTEKIKSSKAALDLVRSGQLVPMTERLGYRLGRNKYGAFIYERLDEKLLMLTQLFVNREIWGINTYAINKEYFMGRAKVEFGFIPCVIFENTFIYALENYLKFASETLKLPLPLRFISGATGVEGYKMHLPYDIRPAFFEEYGGRVVDNNIIYEGEIKDYGEKVTDILRPFFDKVWEECGLIRPNKERLG